MYNGVPENDSTVLRTLVNSSMQFAFLNKLSHALCRIHNDMNISLTFLMDLNIDQASVNDHVRNFNANL